jgi:ParB/RepB/Spo0J family partition protein
MKVRVDSLSSHPMNSDIYQLSDVEDLMKSIEEVGILQPITINRDNQILSGHRRWEAVKRLNWIKVDVVRIDIKKGDDILYLIHFNKQRVKTITELLSEYDQLKKYYKNHKTKISNIRLKISEDIKVSNGTLAKILYIRKNSPDMIQLIEKGILTVNQSYILTNRKQNDIISRTSFVSDRSKIENTEKFRFFKKSSNDMSELKNGECDLIFCSPPFWRLRIYDNEQGLGNENTPDEYVDNLVNHLFDECWRILSKNGNFMIEIGDTFYNSNLQNIPHKVAIKLQERGFIQRNSIVVHRSNPKPSSSKSNLTTTYSMLFHFVKSLDYNYELTRTKLSENTKPSHPPRHRSIKETGQTNSISSYIPNPKGKNMGDFLSEDIVRTAVSNQKSSNGNIQHPAQFPEQLVWLVLNSTCVLPFKDDPNYSPLVCDPFCGNLTVNKVIQYFNNQKVNPTNIRFVGYDIKQWF